MKPHPATVVLLVLLVTAAGGVGYVAVRQAQVGPGRDGSASPSAVAVEVAPIARGVVRDIRVFSGTLEASHRFTVTAKVAGLLETLDVDLGDPVARDATIGQVESLRFQQAVAEMQAELSVREAERTRAESRLGVATREHDRERTLLDQGITSESDFDTSLVALRAAEADLAVAEARVQQARATLELARLRLDESVLRANWTGGPESAVVGERHLDTGATLAVGDPIVTVVTLDPIRAVVSVTERDYTRLRIGQPAEITTDAAPARTFAARVERIAPVFREASRQARVELSVDNAEGMLRPGMFVRVRVVLETRDADTIVPLEAVARRDGRDVLFYLPEGVSQVRLMEANIGLIEGDRAEWINGPTDGRVVVLGHQLLGDASPVRAVDRTESPMPPDASAAAEDTAEDPA